MLQGQDVVEEKDITDSHGSWQTSHFIYWNLFNLLIGIIQITLNILDYLYSLVYKANHKINPTEIISDILICELLNTQQQQTSLSI